MKTGRPFVRSLIGAVAAASWLCGCGGGDDVDPGRSTITPNPAAVYAASDAQARKLGMTGPVAPLPATCTRNEPVAGNIHFGQPGWTGGDEPGDPVPVGAQVAAAVPFTDDPLDVHTVQWSWGDDTPPGTAAVTESAGAGPAKAVHTYLEAGVHTVTAVITDACASRTVVRQLVVYDPAGGFVAGGGWIASTAGALRAEHGWAGRASFAFVSSDLKGATGPAGQAEFRFRAARLVFHSAGHERLVVAGARA